MSKKYFAYGSCANIDSFKKTMSEAGCEDQFQICGVGILNDYRLAFTKESENWRGGALDIIESPGDYVLGVVYEIPEEAIQALDRREGAPNHYRRVENIEVELGFDMVEVFTYMVVESRRQMNEIAPSKDYFEKVYEGIVNRFPLEYINKYLIDHCRNKFGISHVTPRQNSLYHDYGNTRTEFMRYNPEFYELLKQMTLFFGDDNEKVETVQPTPEMFRLLVKCAEVAARGELDFSHMIPRGMYNKLAGEFQRISGVKVERV